MGTLLLERPTLGECRMDLRPYQYDAIESVRARYEAGDRSTCIVMATGLGKTVVMGATARRVVEKGGRVLVLAHRGELIEQAADKFDRMGISTGIEKADQHARSVFDPDPPVVIATVQTMQRDRLAKWQRDHFKLVMIDEAHHAVAESYQRIFKHFAPARRLGVTATPDRADGENLGQVFQSVAYEFSLFDAIQAPPPGPYLCRLKIVQCDLEIDLRGIRTTGGDFNLGDLEERIRPLVDMLANAIRQEVGGRKTLVFTPDVGSAQAIATALQALNLRAEWTAGDDPARREKIRRFHAGEYQILCNCALLLEGFDCPDVSAVVLCRPTKSRALMAQMCLDEKTEILTRRGWVGPDAIRDDDSVAAFDLERESIRWSPILSRVDRTLADGEEMMGILSPSLDIRVNDGHRMVMRRIVGRAKVRQGWEFVEARDLAEQAGNYEIPVSAVEDGVACLPLTDDEIRFIGWFITDGYVNKARNAITIYQDIASPYHDRIKACLEGCGFKYGMGTETRATEFSESSTIVKYRISRGKPRATDKHLSGWERLEPYIDKDFSLILDEMSRHQLEVLIDAMNCGDGLKRKVIDWTPRTTSICTGNKTMADRLQSLCVRRGFRCNVSTGHWNASPIYILHIKAESARYVGGRNCPDRPTFKGRSWEEGERVWCVEVETGAIVTRREGKVAIVGNCGRGTRLAPGKEDCLIIDFDYLTAKHSLVKPVELVDTTTTDDEILELADEIVRKEKGVDLLEAVKRAEAIHNERQVIRIRAREREVKYRRVSYDPVAVYDTMGLPWRGPKSADAVINKATPKQVEWLKKLGVEGAENISKTRASQMIDHLKGRMDRGLASMKQVSWLINRGVDPDVARAMTKDEASARLDELFGKKRDAG